MSHECIKSQRWDSDRKIKISLTIISNGNILEHTFRESITEWVLSWHVTKLNDWLISQQTTYRDGKTPKRSQPHNAPISNHKKPKMDPNEVNAAISIEFDVKRSKTNCYPFFAWTKQRRRFRASSATSASNWLQRKYSKHIRIQTNNMDNKIRAFIN